jgi:hypothetical protein
MTDSEFSEVMKGLLEFSYDKEFDSPEVRTYVEHLMKTRGLSLGQQADVYRYTNMFNHEPGVCAD